MWLAVFTLNILSVPAPTPNIDILMPQLHEAVSAQRIKKDVERLVGFGTRHTLSDTRSNTRGIGAARRFIAGEFKKISAACGGCIEVRRISGMVSGEKRIPKPTEVVNIVAIQKGTTDPNRYVMISGDIDSRISDPMDATGDSPGANDNATGAAATLEAARILSKHKFKASIVYAALSGEEQGLFGGKIFAEKIKGWKWNLEAVINNDMIGNISGVDGVINNTSARVFAEGTKVMETPDEARKRRFQGGEVDSPSRNLARYIVDISSRYAHNLDMMMIYRLDRFSRGGHHRPFNDQGFAAVRIMEAHENYNRQHQNIRVENGIRYGDTIDGVNFDYAAKLVGVNIMTLAGLAQAPAKPVMVEIKGAVQASATLSWQSISRLRANDILGYRIYWRLTTAPQWSKARSVFVPTPALSKSTTHTYTLKNIVIDNYFFGVASVSRGGFESPVVFPGPMGR